MSEQGEQRWPFRRSEPIWPGARPAEQPAPQLDHAGIGLPSPAHAQQFPCRGQGGQIEGGQIKGGQVEGEKGSGAGIKYQSPARA
ncbi:MAG: hypothetical protein O2977_05410, partial [Cyanobacteria bacterium]|nr:hypothetical protein [Cyanobacteriota bacterium]